MDNVYTIYPDKTNPVSTYCDMTNGGWTVGQILNQFIMPLLIFAYTEVFHNICYSFFDISLDQIWIKITICIYYMKE